ncbi:MAG: DUF4331 domain-containing protein [Candidatus Rokubacteria bacterium]|nr:DUF4331 domain-containing protein [Candidatus Rokubacteria bacterium]
MTRLRRRWFFRTAAALVAGLILAPGIPTAWAANHREAPLTALDHKADITDWFAFVSYDDPSKVTMLLNVDPLLEPSNGPNYFPFDPEILYAFRIDNNFDADEDIVVEVRFKTEIRAPGVFTALVGGVNVTGVGTIPPITALDGAGSEGFNLRQKYTVTMKKKGSDGKFTTVFTTSKDTNGRDLIAVPSNVGPKTMPNYAALAKQGIYDLGRGIRIFAGTVYDPFYIDLGAAFDTLNFRSRVQGGVLTADQDANDNANFAPDDVSGFNVNTIALELPIAMLTRTGQRASLRSPNALIGTYGTTSRPRIKVQPAQPGAKPLLTGNFVQIQRMSNALINELIIGTGDKDKFSMSEPKDDGQFASYVLDPLLARVFGGLGLPVPPTPRNDLLFLAQYNAFATLVATVGGFTLSGSVPAGPVADLLRLNTGVGPTAQDDRKRLGLLAGDVAGYPNGRRVSDDVTDISSRAVAGVLLGPPFDSRVGDGVNTKNIPYQETFPYVAFAVSGKNSRHIDPREAGCGDIPPGSVICPRLSPVESPANP